MIENIIESYKELFQDMYCYTIIPSFRRIGRFFIHTDKIKQKSGFEELE